MFRDFKKYEVFEDGRIWSYVRNKWMKLSINDRGYLTTCLMDNNNKPTYLMVHRVVYEAVKGEPIPEGMQVNHIDENKLNNHISNLNLMTPKENMNWGSRNERARKTRFINHPPKLKQPNIPKVRINNPNMSKPVEQYDKEGNLLNTYPSMAEVERLYGFFRTKICACCRGKLKTAYGFIWKYAN